VRDALKSYLALAGGLTDVTRQRATAAAKALVAQGEATAEQVTTLADDLLKQSKSNREAVASPCATSALAAAVARCRVTSVSPPARAR
jgi:polyhydroxyalkanoate synthesis regulator phasin